VSARPFFSVAIPSKNRPAQVRQAVRSVLEQTCQDFEIVVCDNSDEAEAAATAEAVRRFGDPRLVYVRTNGQLSMPDNWERAVGEARGEFVGILTDRSVFLPHALERARAEIEQKGVPLVAWFGDSYGRGPSGRDFRRRVRSGEAWHVESRRLLEYFVHGHPKHASKRLPKLMTCVCAREAIERVRASAVGRICPPVCPDYTSGYLMLAHTERIVLLDEALFLSCGSGNGSSFRRRGALADRFMRDLGMTWEDLVDRMPTRACFTSALVLNDLMRLKDALPERFAGLEVDHVQYYLGCLTDYEKSARGGADRFEDYDELLEGLSLEPPAVQHAVRTRQIYVRAAATLPPETSDRDRASGDAEGEDDAPGAAPQFATVFEAMEWAAANPFPGQDARAAAEPLEMPLIADMEPAWRKPKHRPAGARRRVEGVTM
jgi:hypothetical protein